ncbi:hypothetical protein HHK36_025251 [Tetracentron sinense]|uniref:V-type proton ATPase subunit C n=1 Tax=Tetracentron sinense TaxID=13715 RepID=A0A835D8A4_TETSI|nr:hypothetical protein HHK36_025251 [Tetracentron sinense]
MAAQQNRSMKPYNRKEKPVCTNCGITGHTIDKCYKLHGYPPRYKFTKRPSSSVHYVAQSLEEITDTPMPQLPITAEQCDQLLALLRPRADSHHASTNQVGLMPTTQDHLFSKMSELCEALMETRYRVVSFPVQNSASSLWSMEPFISKHSFDTPLYRDRVAEYNNVRSQLNAINRKQSRSLGVRDLSNLMKPEDIITSEHLVTLLAVVPKYSQKDWLSSYETLNTYVVPRSSKKLLEDNEYALFAVTLFGRVADNFKTSARERGYQVSFDLSSSCLLFTIGVGIIIMMQVRDFEYSPEAQESRKQELERLMQDQETLRSSVLQWCYTSYGEVYFMFAAIIVLQHKLSSMISKMPQYIYFEVFSSWMHFCAVLVFAESILRYGLPPSFLVAVLAPSVKSEKKVCSILEGLCDSANRKFMSFRSFTFHYYVNSVYNCIDWICLVIPWEPFMIQHMLKTRVQEKAAQEISKHTQITYWKSEDEVGGMAHLGGDADAHPYVSFSVIVCSNPRLDDYF